MMQRLINQIYWSSNNIFDNGTKLKITRNQRIMLHNSLMIPGRAISHWDSSLNYQGDKTVPQLPILKVGEEYRIVAYLKTNPNDSYLIRLSFRDIQGTEIKRIDFRSSQHKFIFPVGAVTYSVEIINNGFIDLEFSRIEIGPATLPLDAYGDIWVQDQLHEVSDSQPLNIILINDGKQSRRTHPEIVNLHTKLPIQPISISWQFDGNMQEWFDQWLQDNQVQKFHLISTSPRFDRLVMNVANNYPQAEVMITSPKDGSLVDYHTWQRLDNGWINDNLNDVDWQDIINEMKNVWERGEL